MKGGQSDFVLCSLEGLVMDYSFEKCTEMRFSCLNWLVNRQEKWDTLKT